MFLYGVADADMTKLTPIKLFRLHRRRLVFESLPVFRGQIEGLGKDLAGLSDVGGGMVSSLASLRELESKLKHCLAA